MITHSNDQPTIALERPDVAAKASRTSGGQDSPAPLLEDVTDAPDHPSDVIVVHRIIGSKIGVVPSITMPQPMIGFFVYLTP